MKENEELIQALSDYFVEAGLIPTDSEKAEGLAEYSTVNESNGEIECTFYPEVHHAARGMVQRIQKEREENWEAKTITASFYYEGVDGFYLRSKYAAQFAEDNEVVIEELKKATNQATFGELRKNDA
jgi:hypothetical protein